MGVVVVVVVVVVGVCASYSNGGDLIQSELSELCLNPAPCKDPGGMKPRAGAGLLH